MTCGGRTGNGWRGGKKLRENEGNINQAGSKWLDRKEGVPILFISLPFLQQVQFTLRDSILRAMARPGCREKLTEGPPCYSQGLESCTDASPVLA